MKSTSLLCHCCFCESLQLTSSAASLSPEDIRRNSTSGSLTINGETRSNHEHCLFSASQKDISIAPSSGLAQHSKVWERRAEPSRRCTVRTSLFSGAESPRGSMPCASTTRLNSNLRIPEFGESLLEFVSGGKGIIGIHAATDNFPRGLKDRDCLAVCFDAHPWTADGTWAVKIEDPRHPLNASFQGKDFLLKDEIYRIRQINLRKNARILLGLDMKAERNRKVKGVRSTDRDIPISWVKSYGKGVCSIARSDTTIRSTSAGRSSALPGWYPICTRGFPGRCNTSSL